MRTQVQQSGFRKRGLANGVSPLFSENETRKKTERKQGKKTERKQGKNGKKTRKKTEKKRKENKEKNGKKTRKKTEKENKEENGKKKEENRKRHRSGDPFAKPRSRCPESTAIAGTTIFFNVPQEGWAKGGRPLTLFFGHFLVTFFSSPVTFW